jgi:hypothetical protein
LVLSLTRGFHFETNPSRRIVGGRENVVSVIGEVDDPLSKSDRVNAEHPQIQMMELLSDDSPAQTTRIGKRSAIEPPSVRYANVLRQKPDFGRMIQAYNLEGCRRAGQTRIGNWFEDRFWNDDYPILLPTAHGPNLMAQPGYEHKKVCTMYQKKFRPPPELRAEQLRKDSKKRSMRTIWVCPDPQRNPRP